MNGAFLRRRDQTVRSLRVEHYSSAVNTDGDQYGRKTLSSLKNAGFSEQELKARTVQLPDDADLEAHIVGSGWRPLVLAVAKECEKGIADDVGNAALAETLRTHKPLWARRLGDRLRRSPPAVDDLRTP